MKTDQREQSMAEQAAEWLQRLQTGGPEERAKFIRWLKQSPMHVREVLIATSIDKSLDELDSSHRWDIDLLVAKASANVRSAHPLHGADTTDIRDRHRAGAADDTDAREHEIQRCP